MDNLEAISVLDGRYCRYTSDIAAIFSEYGLIRRRVYVELQWLKFLLKELNLDHADRGELRAISAIFDNFDTKAAATIKETEKITNHDVKAVEYFIKDRLSEAGLERLREWVHFGCTSEDINNTAYALMIQEGRQYVVAEVAEILRRLESLGKEYKKTSMISRTHGQPATPTTMGKEMINFAWRLRREYTSLRIAYIQAKMNGASGNFCAHQFACPDTDWIAASRNFLASYLGLTPVMLTTQINPNSYISEILHILIRIAAIIIDLDRDMWGYISLGYFRQRSMDSEIGSSTMPHKVNPIDFENSEGNMGVAISLMEHMAVKLLNSRFQRDLSDSTVLRNLGAVFGYMMIGLKSSIKGLSKVVVDQQRIASDVEANPEILAEAIQTVMRVYKEDRPYEKLKTLTRGRSVSRADVERLIEAMENVPDSVKKRLSELSVGQYTGLSEELVDWYFAKIAPESV
ncbi:MAG: adenylosuccinate lyase [Desulfosalsimonadaceae bacterium]